MTTLNRAKIILIVCQWIVLIAALLCFFLIATPAHCQDIYVPACSTNYQCQLASNQPWATGNQTWIFTPIGPSVSVYVYVHNRNTTSAHNTQTLSMFQTGSTTVSNLSSNADQWAQDKVALNTVAGASCNNVNASAPLVPGASGTGTCYIVTMAAAQVAVKITGSIAQAGSPDTFDLSVVQIVGYPGGNQPGEDSSSAGGANLAQLNGTNIPSASAAGTPTGPTSALTPALPVQPVFQFQLNSGVATTAPNFFNIGCVEAGDVASAGTDRNMYVTCDKNADAVSPAGFFDNLPYLFNGTNWDRNRSQSSANATTAGSSGSVLPGVSLVTGPAGWSVPVQAASASNCSASQPAGGASVRHCAIGVTMCVSATAAQGQLFVNLRDGATGAGTVKWNGMVGALAATGGTNCTIQEFASGPICGTANTAMTLELSAATAATDGCSATLRGYDVQ